MLDKATEYSTWQCDQLTVSWRVINQNTTLSERSLMRHTENIQKGIPSHGKKRLLVLKHRAPRSASDVNQLLRRASIRVRCEDKRTHPIASSTADYLFIYLGFRQHQVSKCCRGCELAQSFARQNTVLPSDSPAQKSGRYTLTRCSCSLLQFVYNSHPKRNLAKSIMDKVSPRNSAHNFWQASHAGFFTAADINLNHSKPYFNATAAISHPEGIKDDKWKRTNQLLHWLKGVFAIQELSIGKQYGRQ